ncbi:MAG TPA: GH3 auxin-responsive promoter family protein [Gemmataceae bacterium]|nr:GH3 auxin-responsive promoter family protein [Gemmataceae bacterium]
MNLALWLNTVWMWKCAGEARAFFRASRHVAQAQADVLVQILHRGRATDFGRAHGFCHIHGPRDYQQHVPLSCYEDYAASVRRIAAGETGILTADPVELLEPTSGTTQGEKLIPCTGSLRRQFQRAVAVWVYDLFRHRPALRHGRAYWSISPALGPRRYSSAGIPIGFEDDAAYLGAVDRFALSRLVAVPSAIACLDDMETFRYCTLLRLLATSDLTLISVWNPTFLTVLLGPLENWHERLCFDLAHGQLSAPVPLPPSLAHRLALRDPDRAAKLAAVFRSGLSWPEKLQRLWPRLALISCWGDAAAARSLPVLRGLFPDVEIQPKGLLATEGCVSFPLLGRAAPALAVRSHFFEFQESQSRNDRSACRLAHELDLGGRYFVVLTTAGGLYRYQLRDEVEVVGFENECPLLRFLGKADLISDLVGEKLAEPHVRAVLDRLFAEHDLTPPFAMVVPINDRPPHYRLYLQAQAQDRDFTWPGFEADLEAGLQENPYYRYAIRLGQLARIDVEVLDPLGEPGWLIYERACMARGQRAGNIKPAALDPGLGWAEAFGSRRGRSVFVNRS